MSLRASSPTRLPRWLRWSHWDGLGNFAEIFRRRLRRWAYGLIDLDPFTPAPRKPRGYWPRVEQLEIRQMPSITVYPAGSYGGDAGMYATDYPIIATFTDSLGFKGAAAYTATVAWGDDSPDTSGGIDGSGHVYAAHVYAASGTYTATVTVTGDGGSGSTNVTVHISDGLTEAVVPIITSEASPLLTGVPTTTLAVLNAPNTTDPAYSIVYNGNAVAVNPIVVPLPEIFAYMAA